MNYDYVVGIDLGTTNTLACYFQNGRKKLLKFAGGATMLPSIIYTNENGAVNVGVLAENKGAVNPENMIRSAKTYIGNFELNKTWTCNGKTYTPTDVAVEVLKEVRREFIKRTRANENAKIGAVITVPAYFNDNQRDETRKAGIAAGFEVMWILEEPTAAAIEAVHEKQLDKKVFVVDIGGGTFDLSVLEANHAEHTYKAIAIDGDDRLGGDDFDKIIQEEFIRHIEDDTGKKMTNAKTSGLEESEYNKLMHRLLTEARTAKEKLSELLEWEVNLPNLTTLGGKNYELDFILTRKSFERICKPLFDRIFNQINSFAKHNKNFKLEEIGHIILAGGTCFIPHIHEKIAQDLGIIPDDGLPLGQLVVSGAARLADSMTGVESDSEEIKLLSILPHSLGVEVLDDNNNSLFDKILAKDSPYPCFQTKIYETSEDNQTEVWVNVYEAVEESEKNISAHRFRGSLILKDLPAAPRGKSKVEVKFEFTKDQRLKVTVVDKQNEKNSKEAFIDKTAKVAQNNSTSPIDMVLMLDNSGSMFGEPLKQAKKAAKNLITKMFDFKNHRMALMTFNESPEILSELTNSPEILVKKLAAIIDYGGTEMISAFKAAENILENSTRQKIILMVTDGYPNFAKETLTTAKKLRANGIKIIAIGVGEGFNKDFLDDMAGKKSAFTIKNMSELTATFERVMNSLRRGDL